MSFWWVSNRHAPGRQNPLKSECDWGDPLKSVLNPSSQNGTEKGSRLARTLLSQNVTAGDPLNQCVTVEPLKSKWD